MATTRPHRGLSRAKALEILDAAPERSFLRDGLRAVREARAPGAVQPMWTEVLLRTADSRDDQLMPILPRMLYTLHALPRERWAEAAAEAEQILGLGSPARRRACGLFHAHAELEAQRETWGDPLTDLLLWAVGVRRPRLGQAQAVFALQEACAELPTTEALEAALASLPARAPHAAEALAHLRAALPMVLDAAR